MKSTQKISKPVKLNFYINLLNFIPFLLVIITGLILQFKYHLHHFPDHYTIEGLDKSGFLNLHIISAAISLAGIIFHCILHWKFISAVAKKIFIKKSGFKLSFLLFVIYLATVLTSFASWLFFNQGDSARFVLVEIHDKVALLLVVFSVLHLVKRSGWMIRNFQNIKMM